jgi:uncharacterized protein YkwD
MLVVLLGSLILTAVPAVASLRSRMLDMVNGRRESHGLHPVRLSRRLSGEAQHHTAAMVRRDQLFHTGKLAGKVRRWHAHRWGENVGCAGSLRRLMRAFMRSPEHRANLLSSGFHFIGIGVTGDRRSRLCGSRTVWATQQFYG